MPVDSKERLPSFHFYPRDWLSSETIMRLRNKNPRALVLYLDLLCRSWLSEPPATLPADHSELASLCFIPLSEFEEAWPLFAHEFKSDGNGRLLNQKLHNIFKRTNGFKKRAKAGGMAKAEKMRLKTSAKEGAK